MGRVVVTALNADHLAMIEAAARGFAQGLLPRAAAKRTRAEKPAVAEQQYLWPSMSDAPEELPLRSREIPDLPPISARELEEIMNRDPDAPPPGYYERDNPTREEMVNAQLG